ncbi:MAG: AAA family ATPase, partial [Succinivibrio sp.]|nr:AAA family ATPase [Succinivibrio sp.]
MSESLKKVATDIKVFSDFIINDCYYVDKTKYIKTIMEDGSASILFTRPRRFGKSITISMLQSFLEMNYENPSDKSKQIALFKDTEIFKDKEFCDKYMGQYPVIFLSLKEAWDTNSYEDALQSLYEELSNSVKKFNFLLSYDKFTENQLQNLNNILTISNNALDPVKKKAVAERMIR